MKEKEKEKEKNERKKRGRIYVCSIGHTPLLPLV
jgi:hypothetical protein